MHAMCCNDFNQTQRKPPEINEARSQTNITKLSILNHPPQCKEEPYTSHAGFRNQYFYHDMLNSPMHKDRQCSKDS